MASESRPGRPLKVLGIYWQTSFWSMGPRSGANSFFLAPHAFVEWGHEMHVSLPRGRGQAAEEIEEGMLLHRYGGAIRFDSNPRRPLPVRLISRIVRYVYYIILGTWHAVRLARRIQPDLIVGYHYQSAAVASLTARFLGRPNVTRLFGTQLSQILGNRLKLLAAFQQVLALKAPASFYIMHDDGSQGDRAARRFGVPAAKLRYWRDGYDPELYRPDLDREAECRRLGIPAGHLILFCVGRLGEDKRMGRLVEVLPDVLREVPRTTLMLVGEGPERPEIEERIRALGLEGNVCMPGAVVREELYRYFNLGDVFVGVSDRTNANLPPVEAMVCGKPLVALGAGDTRLLVEDGVTGVLVDPAAWRSELPRALADLLQDDARRRRMGTAGREKILRELPTTSERQHMEVELGQQAVEAARRG